jgi:methylamine---glutamate N-methyltransferase subunit A
MCGIVGLHLKNADLHPRLGALLAPMLDCMSTRGPDSAGLALFDEPTDGRVRWSLRSVEAVDWSELATRVATSVGVDDPEGVEVRHWGDGAVLTLPGNENEVLRVLERLAPQVVVVGRGHTMEVCKDVGAPGDICERYGIAHARGFQGIGHTRMATESAVTTDHSHPFAPALDLALVHNGSFSNPASIRRRLMHEGVSFTTDNDSEVAARYIARQRRLGADLEDALRMVLKELDGFYTLLVTTSTEFSVMRDSFACKPAVIAETKDYVAVASEYHALAGLPGIGDAAVFEPAPEEVYTWTR